MAPDSLTDWLALVGGVVVPVLIALWRFSKTVDKHTSAVDRLAEKVDAQWKRLDEHTEKLDSHGVRIVRLETRMDYHECGEKVASR